MPIHRPAPPAATNDLDGGSSYDHELRGNVAAARARAIRNAAVLSELLAERPELHVVDSPAVWAHESIRWSA